MKFTKPSLAIADQIALLEGRGMIVSDHAKAEHYLRHVSYYRLRAYWLPFEILPSPANGAHLFTSGTTFEDALELYVFDRQLRLLVMDAVERIEVSLRVAAGLITSRSHMVRTGTSTLPSTIAPTFMRKHSQA